MPGPDEYIEHDEKQKEPPTRLPHSSTTNNTNNYYEIDNNKIKNKNNPRNKTLHQYPPPSNRQPAPN